MSAHLYQIALHPGGLGNEFLAAIGLCLMIGGGCLSLFGWQRCWYFAFPIGYLVFAIPIPDSITIQITFPLREMVSVVASKLINMVGIPVYQEGNLLHLSGVSLGVEDACSGIRSLWTMLAGAVAFGFVMGCNFFGSTLLTLLAIPLAIVQNLLRVFITAILCNFYGLKYAEGWRHELIGWLTFVLAVGAIMWLAWQIHLKFPSRKKAPAEPSEEPDTDEDHFSQTSIPVYSTLALMLVAGIGLHWMITSRYTLAEEIIAQQSPDRRELQELPERLAGFTRARDFELPEKQLKTLSPSDYYTGFYRGPRGRNLEIMMFYWAPVSYRDPHKQVAPHPPDFCYAGMGWSRQEASDYDLTADFEYEQLMRRIYTKKGKQRVVLYWRTIPLLNLNTSLRERIDLLKRTWEDPTEILGMQYSVAIAVDVGYSVDEAYREAQDFARALKPYLVEYGFSMDGETSAEMLDYAPEPAAPTASLGDNS